MRLIDADELKKEAYPFPCAIGVEYAVTLRRINEVPTIDAEPVRRAHWKASNRRGTLCDTYVCSECGNMVMQAEGYTYSCTYNYCPNCGTKMDGEEE